MSDGGRYQLRARLEKDGVPVGETSIPVRLLWGVRPTALPESVAAGNSYGIEVKWQELPGYEAGESPPSIDRAALWDSDAAIAQHYNIVLELRNSSESVVASYVFVTREATGSHTLDIDELLGLVPLEEDFEPDSWNDVLSEVEEFLVFWKVYYCGLTPEEAR